ncbi:HNH endonuclease [Anaerobacillus isosaccharinicus]|uniref:Putative HNH nuclease YajD n=1 Tax=Anaerobacillus isosaccharinicus TaxID=1532552 RepID=A0A1S2L977_9BACI|nr:HNH endonuclease signature motif containing protein [Anaerobacillus isosaccharinicus]MBA5584563.1 HNH endonuclease [Anaerobacillus isosaccharinicus]QOY37054.1 HNH endonuclease [Anaerobacillus isosaccharinicus]
MKKPLKPCSKSHCPNLTYETYCDQHKSVKAENNRYYDKYHRSDRSKKFYHSKAWKRVRELIKIRDNGLCRHCLENKRITVGTIVDHIIPLEQDWDKRLHEDNLQLLCQSCHNKKTAEDTRKG